MQPLLSLFGTLQAGTYRESSRLKRVWALCSEGIMADLTDKQRAFVDEYIVDLNATQAAIRAGYSKRTAYATGAENLRKPQIASAIEEAKARRAERTKVTADRVVTELARLAFSDMRHFVEWGSTSGLSFKASEDLSKDDSAAVTEVKVTPGQYGTTMQLKLGHKDSALRMLAEHVGLFERGQGREGDEFDRLLEAINAEE